MITQIKTPPTSKKKWIDGEILAKRSFNELVKNKLFDDTKHEWLDTKELNEKTLLDLIKKHNFRDIEEIEPGFNIDGKTHLTCLKPQDRIAFLYNNGNIAYYTIRRLEPKAIIALDECSDQIKRTEFYMDTHGMFETHRIGYKVLDKFP